MEETKDEVLEVETPCECSEECESSDECCEKEVTETVTE